MKRILVILLTISTLVTTAQARQPQRGYHGFVEWSSSVRNGKVAYIYLGDLIEYLGTNNHTRAFFTFPLGIDF